VNGPDDADPLSIAGGTPEHEALDLVERIEQLDGVTFAGVTTYPGVRFDLRRGEWVTTPNFETMIRFASKVKERLGLDVEHINPAGNNCVESISLIAAAGATYCEPGQAFVGGLVANAFSDQPEVPAIAYVTEVSHIIGTVPYVYAASMVANNTIGIWNPLYYDALGASLSRLGVEPLELRVRSHPQRFPASDPTAFMYNSIQPCSGVEARVGDTVIFGFRTQLYRANGGRLAVVEGIHRGEVHVLGFSDRNGVALAGRSGAPEPDQQSALAAGKVLA
jgi:predicted amino acid racemase